MRPLPKAFLIIVLFACVLIAGLLLPRGSRETFTVSAPPAQPASVFSIAVVWPDVSALAARLGAEETMGAISAELERVAVFTNEIEVLHRRAQSTPAVTQQASGNPESTANGGGIDFEGLANCEGSGINGWRTGLYGLETNTNDVGSWSIEAQQAKVREIYAAHGATAWGVNCRRFFGG